jgi:hypothetical protein
MAATISINGREYDIEADLNDQQRYLASQVERAQRTEQELKMELDRAIMCKKGFSEALMASLSSEESNGEISGTSAPED